MSFITDKKTSQRVPQGYMGSGPGLRNVGSYQVSGMPWITGSVLAASKQHKIEFPYVTKKVTVWYTGSVNSAEMRVHFAPDNGDASATSQSTIAGHHYISLNTVDDNYTFEVKCKEIYISRPADGKGNIEYKVVAELTNIDRESMWQLSGSGINHDNTAITETSL